MARNVACPDCRIASRRSATCPRCQADMVPVHGRVPPRSDDQGWRDLLFRKHARQGSFASRRSPGLRLLQQWTGKTFEVNTWKRK